MLITLQINPALFHRIAVFTQVSVATHSHAGIIVTMHFNKYWFFRAEEGSDCSDRYSHGLHTTATTKYVRAYEHNHVNSTCVIALAPV